MTVALTAFGTSIASTTLPTAGTLATTTWRGADGGIDTKISNALGYGELTALGTNTVWAAAAGPIGSIAPSGLGWLLDSALLFGQTIENGLWTPSVTLRVTLGTITADMYFRSWIYDTSTGVYTPIGTLLLSGQTISSKTTYTWAALGLSAASFSFTQYLYLDCILNVLGNSNSSGSSAQFAVHLSSVAGAGVAGDTAVSTPGFAPTSLMYGVTTLEKYVSSTTAAELAALGPVTVRLQCHNKDHDKTQVVNTTSVTAITAGVNTVTPASMVNITTSQLLFIADPAGTSEFVTPSGVTGTSFTATFANAHSASAYTITGETFDWTSMDTAVDLFVALKCRIVLTIEGFANWWLDPTCSLPMWQGMQMWGYQIIQRYGSVICGVEQGNEEFAYVSGACRDASVYYGVISQSYPFLKPLNPSLTVGCFGYTSYSGNIGNNGDPGYWFNALYALGGGLYMDYANFHYYNAGHDPLDANPGGAPALLTIVAAINSAMVSNGVNLPIRVTEFGWEGKGSKGSTTCPHDVGPAVQGAYLVEAYTLLKTVSNVEAGYLYTCGGGTFYDCHDIYGLSSYTTVQAYFAIVPTPPAPPGPPVVGTGTYSVQTGGVTLFVLAGTLSIDNTIGKRSQASFTAYTNPPLHFVQYQQVQIYDASGTLVFSGYITTPQEQKPGFQNSLIHTITCCDQHWLADKRVMAAAFTNKTCGEMVQWIVTNILAQEGVTIGQIYDGIPPATTLYPQTTLYPGGNVGLVPQANFVYCSVSQALDALVSQASAAGIPYYWQIDENKALWFVPYTAIVNTAVVDGTQIELVQNPPTLTRANPTYRNTQYIGGGVQQTATQTEIRTGDGTTQSWAMGYEMSADPTASPPVISIDLGNGSGGYLGYTVQSVGLKGTSGQAFYWAAGDAIIAQDSSGTKLRGAPYNDLLKVVYTGQYETMILAQNAAQVAYQAQVDGTSGIVEEVETDATITSIANGLSEAGQLLTRYGVQGALLQFTTLQSGFAQGQLITVNLPMYGLSNAQMLIEEVSASDQTDSFNIWFTVKAVQGPYDVSWIDFFIKTFGANAPANSINVGLSQNVPFLASFPMAISVAMSLTVNVYACPIVNTTLYPSATNYPC